MYKKMNIWYIYWVHQAKNQSGRMGFLMHWQFFYSQYNILKNDMNLMDGYIFVLKCNIVRRIDFEWNSMTLGHLMFPLYIEMASDSVLISKLFVMENMRRFYFAQMQKNKNSIKNILIFIRVIFFVLLLSGIVYKIQIEVQIVKIEILCFKYHVLFK